MRYHVYTAVSFVMTPHCLYLSHAVCPLVQRWFLLISCHDVCRMHVISPSFLPIAQLLLSIIAASTALLYSACLAIFVLSVEMVDDLGQLRDLFAHLVMQVRKNVPRLHRPHRGPARPFRRPRCCPAAYRG